MAAFEFGSRRHLGHDTPMPVSGDNNRPAEVDATNAEHTRPHPQIKDECIIAFKVYDQFRLQDCLTEDEIGPARAAEGKIIGVSEYTEGQVIEPPPDAASVSIDDLHVCKVYVAEKEPNTFKRGYWDVDLKLVFVYRLTFRDAGGEKIDCIKARSVVNKKVSMFGSISADIATATDFFPSERGEATLIPAEPYIQVEAKGVALSAELKYHRRRGQGDDGPNAPNRVAVTIGMFCIVKLFRLVDLNVQSKGFCIPPECEEPTPVNACDFFESLDFPMDIFAPPQKKEFKEGVSGNIARVLTSGAEPCDC